MKVGLMQVFPATGITLYERLLAERLPEEQSHDSLLRRDPSNEMACAKAARAIRIELKDAFSALNFGSGAPFAPA